MAASLWGWRLVGLLVAAGIISLAVEEVGMAASAQEKKAPAARVCRWDGGKKAALSLRFDDSHPTHIQNALPLLNEYGCIGTFLVNPGNPGYQNNRAIWEGALLAAGHQMGDHTYNHNGAKTDRDAELQVAKCAEVIRQADPEHTQLLVFMGGGGTQWMQRKPFSYLTAKNLLVRSGGGSMSCREDTPWKPSDFSAGLDRAIQEGRWMQTHFHCVGEGYLPISIASFRTVLETARAHRDEVWQAGMNSIAVYQEERDKSALWAYAKSDDEVGLDLGCETDPARYRQPLTLELDLPARATNVVVLGASGNVVPSRLEKTAGGKVVRFDAAPVDASFVVMAKGLGASYRRQQGPDLKASAHPYLFFSKSDLPALKAKMDQPLTGDVWRRIKANADGLASGKPEDWKIEGSHWRVRLLAFAYALTGQRAYAERAWPELEALLRSDEWHMPKAEALRTAEAAGTMAMAYDWMYAALNDDQRKQVRDVMIEHAILPIVADYDKKEWYTHWSRGNWGGVIFGQIGFAALSILNDDPRAADWARIGRRLVWHYTQALGPDGGWGESGSYAEYLWPRVLMFADASRRVSGGQTDLYTSPNLPRLADWFSQLLEPDEKRFVPFSNCGTRTSDGQILLRLAAEYRDGHAQWFGARMAERRESSDPFTFLWADPTLEAKSPAGLPTGKIFRDIDWAFLRSKWDDPQATLFGMKGGQMDWDHTHHDRNSFVLYAYGQPLLIDLRYPHEIWGCTTEAHNLIMVNGKEQAGRVNVAGGRGDPMQRGVIGDLVESDWYDRMVGDATLAYDPKDVTSAVREVMYLKNTGAPGAREYFVVFDDLEATAPARLDWLLHTYGTVQGEGNRVTITQGPAAVDVTVATPQHLSCELSEKNLKEIKCDSPLEGVETVQQIKLRPAALLARGNFVSVLAPRPADQPSDMKVAPIETDNVRGAEITYGDTQDVALFAIEAPEIAQGGIEATGRTCFVRRSGGKVTNAVLHGGDRLVVDGKVLFQTEASGTVVLTFTDKGIEAEAGLYDAYTLNVRAERRPAKVLVRGQEAEFKYNPETQMVEVPTGRVRQVETLPGRPHGVEIVY